MNLKEPRITIVNTDGAHWQVNCEKMVSTDDGLESVSITVLVPRSSTGLQDVMDQAVRRAIALLQGYLDRTPALLQSPRVPPIPPVAVG